MQHFYFRYTGSDFIHNEVNAELKVATVPVGPRKWGKV